MKYKLLLLCYHMILFTSYNLYSKDLDKNTEITENVRIEEQFIQELINKNYQELDSYMTEFCSLRFVIKSWDHGYNDGLLGKHNIIRILKEHDTLRQLLVGGELVPIDLENPESIDTTSYSYKIKFDSGYLSIYTDTITGKIDSIYCSYPMYIYEKIGYTFTDNYSIRGKYIDSLKSDITLPIERQIDVYDTRILAFDKAIVYGPFYATFNNYSTIEFYDDNSFNYVDYGNKNNIFVRYGHYRVDNNSIFLKIFNGKWILPEIELILNDDGTLSTTTDWTFLDVGGEEYAHRKLLKGMHYNFRTLELYTDPYIIE